MITVHHLNNSRSQRILWLLEELNIPYEIKFYHRDPQTMLAPPELKKIHPLGKSPVISDSQGFVIAESGAIIEYILDNFEVGALNPPKRTKAAYAFSYWLHYAEGSAMPPLLLYLVFNRLPKGPIPFFLKPIVKLISDKVLKAYVNPQIKLHIDYIEGHLEKNLWFAGENFTAADIQMSFPLEAASTGIDFKNQYPKIENFLNRIHARTSYQAALKKGGSYDLLS